MNGREEINQDLFAKCESDGGYFGYFRQRNDTYFSRPSLDGEPGPRMLFQGRPVIQWAINNYLGLAGDPAVKEAARRALEQHGTYAPMGSRMLTGNTAAHVELERRLAAFLGKPASVVFNYGYLGVIGTIASLVGPDDVVIMDRLCHASIVDGAVHASGSRRFRTFKHNDLDDLERHLKTVRGGGGGSRNLAIVLRAGALPAPVKVIEERVVGPTVGEDSIKDGLRSSIIGFALVVLFMLVYYRASGFVAIIALSLNLLMMLATMSYLRSTLTLPGMAGIILSLAMAVDANVLIFERIREELRLGKLVRNAVSVGYDRAFSAIFDSHVTSLITAVILFQFGTGPIKGFAVTLTIGLILSLFTAIVVTHMIFDYYLTNNEVEELSI